MSVQRSFFIRWGIPLAVLGCCWPSALSLRSAIAQDLPRTPESIPNSANSGSKPNLRNTAEYSFIDPDNIPHSGISNPIAQTLIDPFGKLQGCGGEDLPDYNGFQVGLYEANANDLPTGILPLPRTGPGTAFIGLNPNIANINPFILGNQPPKGAFNFFLNRTQGQLDVGKRYILAITPPASAKGFGARQIRIVITNRDDVANTVSYQATALDGKGISLDGGADSFTTTVGVQDAATTGLVLSTISLLDRPICIGPSQPIVITKTADRAAAEPGDTVIYRLSVRNQNTVAAKDIVLTDQLPLGFGWIDRSLRAELAGKTVPISATRSGNQVTLTAQGTIPPSGVLSIVYAAQLSPDAIRGTGENLASVSVHRVDTNAVLKDGPARAKVKVRSGLLSDCGTILGRVFEDKNWDGEQQDNEPGIPNAIVFIDDGTRVTTDERGIYSLSNVVAGTRTGVLDLSSVPGYTFAPNRVRKERNSQTQLVRLEPGGMVRLNFAVTPVTPVTPAALPVTTAPSALPTAASGSL